MTKKKNNYTAAKTNVSQRKGVSVWQPERLTLKKGWDSLSIVDRSLYIILVLGTLLYNWSSWKAMPDQVNLLTWFGYSSATVSKTAYCIFSFMFMCYLVYRDIINRSVSSRKIFIPFIFYLANYFMINGILGKF